MPLVVFLASFLGGDPSLVAVVTEGYNTVTATESESRPHPPPVETQNGICTASDQPTETVICEDNGRISVTISDDGEPDKRDDLERSVTSVSSSSVGHKLHNNLEHSGKFQHWAKSLENVKGTIVNVKDTVVKFAKNCDRV